MSRSWRLTISALVTLLVFRSFAAAAPEALQAGKDATVLVDLGELGSGSGFCIDKSGLFITNRHVVASVVGDKPVKLVLNPGEEHQRTLEARVLCTSIMDLALLRVEHAGGLAALPLGDDANLIETQEITAFGYPYGRILADKPTDYPSVSVNTGKITALRRQNGKLDRIQLDAAVNPGNSGGPVLDKSGQVIGVIVSALRMGGQTGINFAIPSSKVSQFLEMPRLELSVPKIAYSARYAPVTLSSAVLHAPGPDLQVELTLQGPAGPRTFPMNRQPDGTYNASVKPLDEPGKAPVLEVSALGEKGLVKGWVKDHPIHVGEQTVDLHEVRSIAMLGKPRVRTVDGSQIDGAARDLGNLTVPGHDGTKPASIDLGTAAVIGVADAAANDRAVEFHVVANWKGKQVARTDGSLLFEDAPEALKASDEEPNEKREKELHDIDEADALTPQDESLALPYGIDSVVVGGGGQLLVLHLKSLLLYAIVDLYSGKITGFVPSETALPVAAAGADKLVIAAPRELHRYDLRTAKLEQTTTTKRGLQIDRLAMGSASSGPLWVRGSKEQWVLFNPATLTEIPSVWGDQRHDFQEARVSADGQTLGGWRTALPFGTYRVRVRGNQMTGWGSYLPLGQVIPNADGSLLCGVGKVLTKDITNVPLVPKDQGQEYRFLPTHGEDLVVGLKFSFDGLSFGIEGSLFNAASGKLLCPLPKMPELSPSAFFEDESGMSPAGANLGIDQRLMVFPDHDLIVTVPPSNDRVTLRHFDFDAAIRKAGDDWIYVQSTPPSRFTAAKPYEYQIVAKASKMPLQYHLDSGPAGMGIAADGRITWSAPAMVGSNELPVMVTIKDAAGQHIEHGYTLSPAAEEQPLSGPTGAPAGADLRQEYTRLSEALKANPSDTAAATKLTEFCLTELDDAPRAKEPASHAGEPTRRIAELAAKPPASLAEPEMAELAAWYAKAAEQASAQGKSACLWRATHLWNAWLLAHENNDAAREEVAAVVEPMAAPFTADLLPVYRDNPLTAGGTWTLGGEGLSVKSLGTERDRAEIVCHPPDDYRLHVAFVLKKGKQVIVDFPVGDSDLTLTLGGFESGDIAALGEVASAKGKRVEFRPNKLETDHPYSLDLFVMLDGANARIGVDLDGKHLFGWKGKQSDLKRDSFWGIPDPGVIGLGTKAAEVTFQSVGLLPISTNRWSALPAKASRYATTWLGEIAPAAAPADLRLVNGAGEPTGLQVQARPGATALVSYIVAKRFARFDGAVRTESKSAGAFRVLCDGREAWKSPATAGDLPFSIPLKDVVKVELVCVGGDNGAKGVWVAPRLLGSDQGPLVAPDAPVWKSVIAGTKGHGAIASETVGAESGDTFDDRAPDGALLVGLRAGYAQRGNNKEWYIHSLQAIYRTADGKRTLGRVCGATGDQMESYEAPPGYAVGVVHVSVRDLVEAISVTFSRITPNGLDQEDAGELYWHGRVGPPQERKDLGNKDRPILGLFGRGTHAIDLLGVYTAPK